MEQKQDIEQQCRNYHLIKPGMVVLIKENDVNNHLTFLNETDEVIFECDVPCRRVKKK